MSGNGTEIVLHFFKSFYIPWLVRNFNKAEKLKCQTDFRKYFTMFQRYL